MPGNISFTIYDEIARAHISSRKLGVGLCTGTRPAPFTPTGPDPCGTAPWTDDKVEERLAYIFNRPAEDLPALLNLWVLPVPDVWWSALHRWITPK